MYISQAHTLIRVFTVLLVISSFYVPRVALATEPATPADAAALRKILSENFDKIQTFGCSYAFSIIPSKSSIAPKELVEFRSAKDHLFERRIDTYGLGGEMSISTYLFKDGVHSAMYERQRRDIYTAQPRVWITADALEFHFSNPGYFSIRTLMGDGFNRIRGVSISSAPSPPYGEFSETLIRTGEGLILSQSLDDQRKEVLVDTQFRIRGIIEGVMPSAEIRQKLKQDGVDPSRVVLPQTVCRIAGFSKVQDVWLPIAGTKNWFAYDQDELSDLNTQYQTHKIDAQDYVAAWTSSKPRNEGQQLIEVKTESIKLNEPFNPDDFKIFYPANAVVVDRRTAEAGVEPITRR